ncbi:AraC family transcriptional regulator [Flavihumibacter petaseus]|uniref:Putative AraC family transcriptional regulator n=1 Tax=Flavihumibacter petaseus NBRC 106054 TaxID=1220578 RepID=A0A0E9MYP6_9BACT|nr:DNA-binding transcriptional regulator [Flavihumibacter petaseus]GAO42714.1 putative AraC family transcriptional regulator [Flavihumibacter petaseus NBRC 106054]
MNKIILLFDISEKYGQDLLTGIVQYYKEHGPALFCRMPIYYREAIGIKGILKFAKEWGAQGIIGQLDNNRHVKKIAESGIHLILEDFKERFDEFPNITGGYYEAGRMGAEYFVKKGFKHFAFYGFRNIVWSRERAEGFEAYLHERGFDVYNFEHEELHTTDLWFYKPSVVSKWLQSLPKPIAIMACDDARGQHITEACKHHNIRIPDDVIVLGVDNDEMTCNLSDPPLSSVNLDTEKGGYEAARLMDLMIQGKVKKPQNVMVMPTYIVTRQSTDIAAASDEHIATVLNFIHKNLENDINVGDVLEQVPISRRSLEKRFLEVTGTSIYKYIFKLRMQRFSQRLLETDKRISEIALEAGFTLTNNISRQFKQIHGCTPGEYRKRHLPRK